MINKESQILFHLANISDTDRVFDLPKLAHYTNLTINDISQSIHSLKSRRLIDKKESIYRNCFMGTFWQINDKDLNYLTKLSLD